MKHPILNMPGVTFDDGEIDIHDPTRLLRLYELKRAATTEVDGVVSKLGRWIDALIREEVRELSKSAEAVLEREREQQEEWKKAAAK